MPRPAPTDGAHDGALLQALENGCGRASAPFLPPPACGAPPPPPPPRAPSPPPLSPPTRQALPFLRQGTLTCPPPAAEFLLGPGVPRLTRGSLRPSP